MSDQDQKIEPRRLATPMDLILPSAGNHDPSVTEMVAPPKPPLENPQITEGSN